MSALHVCVHVGYAWGPFFLQSLHMQKRDADLLRTKLRRLEEENSRKDRQIEQLLDQSRVSHWSCHGGALAVGVGAAGPTAQPDRAEANRVFTSRSPYRRARSLFGLWQRKGLILAG